MSADYPLASRLMTHFATLWGAQKVKSMYLEDDNAIMAANESWERFLQDADRQVLRRVIDALPTMGRDWPPGLAEFQKMYRDFDRVEHRQHVALRQKHEPTDKGKYAIANLKAMLSKEKP